MNLLLQKYNLSHRNPQIYLRIKDTVLKTKWDNTPLLSKHCKELHIYYYSRSPPMHGRDSRPMLTASAELPHCPILTHLTIDRLHIDDSIPTVLGRTIQSGKLPSLPRITFKTCCGATFSSDWPVEVNVLSRRNPRLCDICSRKNQR